MGRHLGLSNERRRLASAIIDGIDPSVVRDYRWNTTVALQFKILRGSDLLARS
jgi:hypothetical protein